MHLRWFHLNTPYLTWRLSHSSLLHIYLISSHLISHLIPSCFFLLFVFQQQQSNSRSPTQSPVSSHTRTVTTHASQELKKRNNSRDLDRYKARMLARNNADADNEQNRKQCKNFFAHLLISIFNLLMMISLFVYCFI